jgi:ABC-type nitrate/sulfonate/bicarbonate transport system substrate-binding protein
MLTVPYFALEQIAAHEGLFAKNGLDVTLVSQTAQGTAGVQAVVAGHADTAQGVTYSAILQAREGSAPIKAVVSGYLSTADRPNYKFYVLKGSKIQSPADLVGARIGIPSLGTSADFYVQSYLADHNIPLNKVTRVAVPPAQMESALLTGQVDVAGLYDVFYAHLETTSMDKVRLLFTNADTSLPGEGTSVYFFTEDFMRSKPSVVKQFVTAMKDAAKFVETNRDQSKKVIARATNLNLDNVLIPKYPKGLCLSKDASNKWGQVMLSLGALKSSSTIGADGITNQFNPDC